MHNQSNKNVAKMKRMQDQTVSKGYRLKTSTHRMIRKVQNILKCTQDGVIGRAVQMYYIKIKKAEPGE